MAYSDDEEAQAWFAGAAFYVKQIETQMGKEEMPLGGEWLLYRTSLVTGLALSLSALEGMKHMDPYRSLQLRFAARIRDLQREIVADLVSMTSEDGGDGPPASTH